MDTNYDSEPVKYCSRCYSLKIRYEEVADTECCMDCGCSDISEAPISHWEEIYDRRYGHRYVQRNDNPKKSLWFRFTFSELKDKVCKSPSWKHIIENLYPQFPWCKDKAESILMFFSKLIDDNRLDDLRMYMWRSSRNK